jgi:dynactin-5
VNTSRLYVFPALLFLQTISLTAQDTGNKVSRRATIAGPQNIILGGKTIIASNAIIRGDLRRTGTGSAVVISLGRYCLISEGCIMRWVHSYRQDIHGFYYAKY